MLAWDTDLIYQYFRLTGEGRLLIGGGTLRETYARARPDSRTPRRLARFVRKTFPALADVRFESYWPGLIGVTRDLLPLAGANPQRLIRPSPPAPPAYPGRFSPARLRHAPLLATPPISMAVSRRRGTSTSPASARSSRCH